MVVKLNAGLGTSMGLSGPKSLLEVKPGIGTIVARNLRSSAEDRAALLKGDLERLAVDARRLGLTEEQVAAALHKHWQNLS